ncbi:YolD-like family protein [Planomicrobium sp. YIM 101495]|nr:YolD-like family protein [Planomicrobium sp. YIM 101495]
MMKPNKHLTVRGQLKDRGRTKWTAMMLTEHVQLLKEWQEEPYLTKEPALEESDMDAILEEIQAAYQRASLIHLDIWRDGITSTLSGIIEDISAEHVCLTLRTDERQHIIHFHEISSATAIG